MAVAYPASESGDPSPEVQLAALGLTVEPFHHAARAGLSARASRTLFAPRNAPGTDLYSHTTEGLRLALAPLGWRPEFVSGQERTVSPGGETAIVVATGEGAVGVSAAVAPSTAHPKGRLMWDAVATNQVWIQEGWAFPELEPAPARRGGADGAQLVWVLLLKAENAQLNLELSLPDKMGDDGRPQSWARRIPLPPIELDGSFDLTTPDDDDPDDPWIDVPVKRR